MRIAGRAQKLELVLGLLVIQFLDIVTSWQIHSGTVFGQPTANVMVWLDAISTAVFIALAVALVAVLLLDRAAHLPRIALLYLLVASLQAGLNVAMLIGTAHVRNDSVLWGLWDLAAGYLQIVAVFTGWYYFVDLMSGGTAFRFPENADGSEFEPRIVDYVFIAFNTNATFGPTSEEVLSRKVKVLMMVQTCMSLGLLLVFVARIVSLFQ